MNENKNAFRPYPVCLTYENPAPYLPQTMLEHVKNGGMLYVVEPIRDGKAFVSTHADRNGHVCTFVNAAACVAIAETGRP